ncbi:MAG TPA: hypothetical protein VG148_12920 [Pyrinomonadaceae bacterium]|nr:hypothetical protein [Pyrinomonadaceae bacterium]
MLFVESRVADREVERGARLAVLDALQQRGLQPLIRSARLHCFEQALAGDGRAVELERAVAAWADAETEEPYVRGDLFCFEDFVYFLVFGEAGEGAQTLRAGLVYTAQTEDPPQKLEAFCRDVEGALAAAGVGPEAAEPPARFEWRARVRGGREAFTRFAAAEADAAPPPEATRGADAARARAAELLEDPAGRGLLRRLSEAQADGRAAGMLASAARDAAEGELVTRLAAAGLVRREVQVSCRKDGRSLFRLPSPEALAMVTASNAVCSECGAAVADERAEELITPTPLAASLLKDGSWMLSRVRAALAGLGLPERAVAARAATSEGEARILADVCGEPFLFVLRDGDFTPADARRALSAEAEARATRLVVVATGKFQEEARARLREHARRRSRAGGEGEVIFVEGADAAPAELREAVERVSREALTRELFELDSSAGLDVGHMLAARFRLTARPGELRDLAAASSIKN